MAEQTKISGPVTVENESASRVAYDLMRDIAGQEFENRKADRNKRQYWLELYAQCFQAAKYGNLQK